jgi:[ribosomal protein S5]-alanine N-acetyltransferase
MIQTNNLKLIPCELKHFETILNDSQEFARQLDVSIVDGWTSFPEALPYGHKYLKAHPEALEWWTYLFVHTADKALIGLGGYKGQPDASGMVEIGYEIAPAYRERGLATEAARGLVDHAFSQPPAKIVDAHTLAEINPSTKVLEKIGLKNIATIEDPDDGALWHWRLRREK